MRTKNYQNFVNNLLNSENILVNENGKLIKFDLFREDLYNYEFLDVYYKHHIPFIIMRPRLDLISRRKMAVKFKKIRDDESSNRFSISDFSKISKDNESTSNLKNLKFEKKYSVQINQMRGSLVLTKMPQKTEENTRNKILNIALCHKTFGIFLWYENKYNFIETSLSKKRKGNSRLVEKYSVF